MTNNGGFGVPSSIDELADMHHEREALLAAARGVLWKLSHNWAGVRVLGDARFDGEGYSGPGVIDRNDATVRELQRIVDRLT